MTLNNSNVLGQMIPAHDYLVLTYVTSGDGVGEIETVTYKKGGASGQTIAILTLTYVTSGNGTGEIDTITRS